MKWRGKSLKIRNVYYIMKEEIMSKRVVIIGVVLCLMMVLPLAAFGADKLIVKDAAGTNTVFVVQDSGDTGVGTATPGSKLHVSGGYVSVDNAGNTGQNAGFSIRHAAATYPAAMSVGGVGNPSFLANWNLATGTQYDTTKVSYGINQAVSSDQMMFMRAPAGGAFVNLMVMKGATGNVGIGTNTPTSKLQVVGLPNHANNAAALAGGLTAGAFYWGCNGDALCVVH